MISVIIPAYNAEKYIDKCLESVLTQQDAEYEVIVVNDGSTDCTEDICLSWKTKYHNLIYIKQENMGQGTARNVAVSVAKGDWLAFLDADDEMCPRALERLQKSIDDETDIIWYEFWLLRKQAEKERIRILLENQTDKKYVLCDTTTFLWDKLIRKACWHENEITLCNYYGEDMLAIYQLMINCKRIKLLKSPLVIHYERENNLSSNSDKVVEILEVTKNILETFENTKEFDEYIDVFFFLVLRQYKLYEQRVNMVVLSTEQYNYLIKGFLELLHKCFPQKWKLAQELAIHDLIVIGYTKIPGFLSQLFHSVRCYSNMDTYLFDNQKQFSNTCVYCIDVNNEGRSSLHGTRSSEWDFKHWQEACEVFIKQIIYNQENIKQIFEVRATKKEYSQLYTRMEAFLEKRVNAIKLESIYSIFSRLENENSYIKPLPNTDSLEKNYQGSAECLRYEYNANIMNSWLKVKNRGCNLGNYLKSRDYYRIAVYGVGFLGERLIEELSVSGIKIEYLIDKSGKSYMELPIYTLDYNLPYVDVIVVSVVHLYEWIEYEIKKVLDVNVISLEDVVLKALQVREERK